MKISVIVPVYNVEVYLTQCLDSILAQHHHDLEIILVNDGSTDNSPQICENFAEIDPRIQLIHQQNSGVSVARNNGIKKATGDFITFVDSDDWLAPQMYAEMLKPTASETHPSVIMCDFICERGSELDKITTKLRKGLYTKSEIESEIYPTLLVTEDLGRIPIVSAWNCLFKRALFDQYSVLFDAELKYSEDYLFMAEIVLHADSFYYLKNHFYYHYRQYGKSRSKKYQPQWWGSLLLLNQKLSELMANSSDCDFSRQLKLQLIHSGLLVSSGIYGDQNLTTLEKINLLRQLFCDTHLQKALRSIHFTPQSLGLKTALYLVKTRQPVGYWLLRKIL